MGWFTDNQPITYLKRFPDFSSGILLFLAPSRRSTTLWAELLRRCREADYSLTSHQQIFPELCAVKMNGGVVMALSSWRLLLNALRLALETEGDQNVTADVRQIEGLCDLMDTQAFLPLHSAELAGAIGTRLLQYNRLIDDVTENLVQNKIATIQGLRATPTFAGYGRYLVVGQFGFMLQVNATWWSALRETPIWLSIRDAKDGSYWTYSPDAEEKLSKLKLEEPPRLLRDGDMILVPIFLPLSTERDEVLKVILAQIDEVITSLGVNI